jgi:hypothetical protein
MFQIVEALRLFLPQIVESLIRGFRSGARCEFIWPIAGVKPLADHFARAKHEVELTIHTRVWPAKVMVESG